jgi:hypothetical protein
MGQTSTQWLQPLQISSLKITGLLGVVILGMAIAFFRGIFSSRNQFVSKG